MGDGLALAQDMLDQAKLRYEKTRQPQVFQAAGTNVFPRSPRAIIREWKNLWRATNSGLCKATGGS